MKEIATCPFCKGKGEVQLKETKDKKEVEYFVRCSACSIRTVGQVTGYNSFFAGKKDVNVTAAMALDRAIDIWNERDPKPKDPIKVTIRKKVQNNGNT